MKLPSMASLAGYMPGVGLVGLGRFFFTFYRLIWADRLGGLD